MATSPAPPSAGGGSSGGSGRGGSTGGSGGSSTMHNSPGNGGGGGGGTTGGISPVMPTIPPVIVPLAPVSAPVEVAGVIVGPPLPALEVAGVTVVGPASLGAFAVVVATIDPTFGGSLTLADGRLTLNLAAGAADTLTLSLVLLPPTTDGSPPLGNLQVGTQMYALTVTDSSHTSVTRFDPGLQIMVNPAQVDLAAAGGDLSQIAVAALDPDAASFLGLDMTTLDDDSLAFALVALTPAPALPETALIA